MYIVCFYGTGSAAEFEVCVAISVQVVMGRKENVMPNAWYRMV